MEKTQPKNGKDHALSTGIAVTYLRKTAHVEFLSATLMPESVFQPLDGKLL